MTLWDIREQLESPESAPRDEKQYFIRQALQLLEAEVIDESETEDDPAIWLPLSRPLYELLEREADRSDRTVEEVVQQWVSVQWNIQFGHRWEWVDCEVDVGVPEECLKEAELWAEHTDSSLDEVMFNVVSWGPEWVPEETSEDTDETESDC